MHNVKLLTDVRALLVDADFALVEGAVVAVLTLVRLLFQMNSPHVFILERFGTCTFWHITRAEDIHKYAIEYLRQLYQELGTVVHLSARGTLHSAVLTVL